MTYLISYDITNNKKRSRISKTLKKYGGIRLQKSVFFIDCSQSGLRGLTQNIQKLFRGSKSASDQVLIVRIHQSAFYNMKIIGQQFDPVLALGKDKVKIL